MNAFGSGKLLMCVLSLAFMAVTAGAAWRRQLHGLPLHRAGVG